MKYDLVIIGGGTAGCAAAYISALKGLKTLLVEKNSFLGGSMTASLVTPAMKTSDKQINTDFYTAFVKELKSIGGQITYSDCNPGWFNPELAKIVLDKILSNSGVDILYKTNVSEITTSHNIIKSLKISPLQHINHIILSKHINDTNSCEINIKKPNDGLSVYIETKYLIDSTGSQEICQNLNCRFLNDKDFQPASLRFIASGIDIEKFEKFIMNFDIDRSATSSCRIDGQIHLSTACTWDKEWALTPLFDKGVESGILLDTDKSYFQIFTIPGMPYSIAFNCPRFTESFDTSNLFMMAKSLKESREAILRLIKFCRKFFPGFENSYISSIAPEPGIRTSMRPLGKYIYTIDDLKSGKTFKNSILVSNYPIDIHSSDKDGAKLEYLYKEYQLPVEALQSADYKNLFFAGRSISADFYAQAALRIIPSCFSMGEGLAKYIAGLAD